VPFVAWSGEHPLAMGDYKPLGDGEGEIKSMFASPEARGTGVAAAILERILDHARAAGLTRLSLETGSRDASAAARRLYARHGFRPCPPFGDYAPDPMSVFMTRTLD
jgi:putative acetyltransferase